MEISNKQTLELRDPALTIGRGRLQPPSGFNYLYAVLRKSGFDEADLNHDGHLSKKEWGKANLDRVADFKIADVNHKGGVSLNEYQAAFGKKVSARERNVELVTSLVVGKSLPEALAAAKAHGVQLRVVEEDGVPCMVTKDYRPDRLNVVVQQGKVSSVSSNG